MNSYLRTTRKQLQRLHRLVGELLDVSRILAGKLLLEPERMDLAEMAREAAARFAPQAAAAGTRLVVDPAHELVVVYLTGVWGLQPQVRDEAINGVSAALR